MKHRGLKFSVSNQDTIFHFGRLLRFIMSNLRVVVGSSAVMTASALGRHEAQALFQVASSKHIQNAIEKMDTLKFKEDVSLHDMKEQMNEFKDHITSVLQDPSAVSAADLQLLTDMIAQLDAIFLAELTRQKTRDVEEYNTKLSQHVKCTTDKNKRIGTAGKVTQDLILVSEKREKHKGCRKAQQSWEIFKADAETVGNSMFGDAIGVPDSNPVSAIDTLCAKRDNWVDHKRDYKDLAKVNNVASCASEQKAFEDTMCTVLTAKASTCIAYDECIVAVSLQNEKTVTEAECDDRLAVEVVLAKTKCHLLHLSKVFNNEDSTSDCDSVTVEDSSLVCTLQPVPAVSPCSSEADITSPTLPSPDGSDCAVWITAEYSFDASYKQVTSCRIEDPCVLPTLIGTHDYSDGCTNSANLCDFYDRHSDACPDYPADDAVNKCCACGGGTPAPSPALAPIAASTYIELTDKACEGRDELGSFDSIQECEQKCDSEPTCVSYDRLGSKCFVSTS